MEKRYLYAAGGLGLAALLAVGLMIYSEKRKPGSGAPAEAEPQGFAKPRGLAFAPDGSLWVADSRNHRLVKQKAEGFIEKRIGKGKEGLRDGEFREPCDVKVGRDGNLYVADTFYTLDPAFGLPWGRVQKLSPEGSFIAGWSKSGTPPNDFFGPRALALDSRNFIYVSDTGNHRIVKFDTNGSFIKAWGSNGKNPGQFTEPFGVAMSLKDELYVVDRLNFRVQVFDDEGSFLREFKIDVGDTEQINREPYIAIDNKNARAYITDPSKGRVQRYGLNGGLQKTYDTALEGKLKQPTGIAVREIDGMVYVSDGELGRIMSIKP